MTTKVLLYGSNGWIGGQVLKLLQDKGCSVVLGNSRVDNKEDLESEILENSPSHVMSFIGRTHGKIGDKVYTTIDYLEQPGKLAENVRDNLFGPVVLGLLAHKYGFHFTYMGTGCIFEFDDTHPFGQEINGFNEDSKPNFVGSSYSVVKGYTDELMHLLDSHTLNVRIRMPITSDYNPRNFITKIIKYQKICSIPNSMSVLPELLPYMIDMALHKKVGTINLVNPGLISHNEILSMYKEIVDPIFMWTNFTAQEQAQVLAAGRSNNYLDTTKLEQLYPVKNIKDSVREVLYEMAKLSN